MAAVELKLNDKTLNKALENATAEGMAYATQHYHSALKIKVNTPNTGERVAVKKQTPGGNKTSRTEYSNPSLPGEAPRKRTGFGQRGIVRELDKKNIVARVGVSLAAIYMYYLEMGTKWIARRPWMIRTLEENKPVMARLFTVKSKKRIPNS